MLSPLTAIGQLLYSAPGLLKNHWGKITTALGILAFLFTPMKDWALHLVWAEQAEVVVVTDPASVQIGDAVQVIVIVIRTGKIPLSPGRIKIYSETAALRRKGPGELITSEIAGGAKFPSDAPTSFVAADFGAGSVRAELQTQYKRFTGAASVTVQPPDRKGKPSFRNFSGTWKFHLGPRHGVMELMQMGVDISGAYQLEGGIKGVVDGLRDGETFMVDLYRGTPDFKWSVDARFSEPKADFLEIKGSAQIHKYNGQRWLKSGSAETFYATSSMF